MSAPIPLSQAALCLDCEVVVEIAQACPLCASELTLVPLETWIGSVRRPALVTGDSTR